MNADPNAAKAIFWEAVERHAPERWPAFLDEACAGRPNLRGQVELLLEAHREVRTVAQFELAKRAELTPVILGNESPVPERPGTVIGPYKLLEQIGEGGFAVVFLAEQIEPVRRRVALKVLKLGMDTRQVVIRFEAERQALAIMDHPNIAKVFDGGATPSGRPYFVMELVRGVPITEFCDQNQLAPRERLVLFSQVCSAVQHAHQKGVIHRDLKPANVLVSRHDTTPVVKVIDFGVAKALGHELTDKTLFTGIAQMVGTPLYMSPEQAGMSDLDIDTRSDIYSLGVLLYELLTGTTPFTKERFQQAALDEIRRIIREEDPPKPSTKLSTMEGLQILATNRSTEPAKLTKLVRGELDWIVMKALEKDRNRRYETANGFAMDVKRYLDHEPVHACPPSAAYRLRKFVRRNTGPAIAGSLVILALVGGMIGTTWGMIRAERASRDASLARLAEAERARGEHWAKEEAQRRLAQAENATGILASVFQDLDPMTAEKEGVTLLDLLGRRLGQAAQQLEGEAVGDPLVVARLQHLLGIALRELGELERAEIAVKRACGTRQRLLGAEHLDSVATKHELALLCRDQGEYSLAEALHHEVLAVRRARLGADHPDTLTSRHHLAILYNAQRRFDLAEALCKEVLAARTDKLGPVHRDTLSSQHRLALLYRHQGKYAQSEALFSEVLAIRTAQLGADHLDTVATTHNLAALHFAEGKHATAEVLFRKVLAVRTAKLGSDHPDTLLVRHHMAMLYRAAGKHSLAEEMTEAVLAARTSKLGPEHPDTLNSQCYLAMLYQDEGKSFLAEPLYTRALAIRIAKLGADHRDTQITQSYLAMLYSSMKKFDRSIPLLSEVLRVRRATLGPDHPETLGTLADLGSNCCDAGRFADAIPALEEVHRKVRDYAELAWVGNVLLRAYARTGKTAEATALAKQLVAAARERYPAESPALTAELVAAGSSLLDAKVYVDAEPLLLRGYHGLKSHESEITKADRAQLSVALERLVQLYDAWGKPDVAAKWRIELRKSKE